MISTDVELLRSSVSPADGGWRVDSDGGFLYPELRLSPCTGLFIFNAFGVRNTPCSTILVKYLADFYSFVCHWHIHCAWCYFKTHGNFIQIILKLVKIYEFLNIQAPKIKIENIQMMIQYFSTFALYFISMLKKFTKYQSL